MSTLPNWEACKENVLPLKVGRSVKSLDENLSVIPTNDRNEGSNKDARSLVFEEELKKKKIPTEKLVCKKMYFVQKLTI
jgi:hypothetical protein